METIYSNTQPQTDTPFENRSRSEVTKIAYLIGIDEKHFEGTLFDREVYDELLKNENATVIRHLCILRNDFLEHSSKIYQARREMIPLSDIECVHEGSIKYLWRKGIDVNRANETDPNVYIAYINQYIQERIDRLRPLFPDWIQFNHIRTIFLMSGGYAGGNGSNIKNNRQDVTRVIDAERKKYRENYSNYPFHTYIVWPFAMPDSYGNILHNDLKFLKILYAANGDCFKGIEYVTDAHAQTKNDVYEFLENAVRAEIFVDCENVDVYAFASTILGLDPECYPKIKKILLFNDVNTCAAWDYLEEMSDIPVQRIETERLLEEKSVVDFHLMLKVFSECTSNDLDSVIIASSDSDYLVLINQLRSMSNNVQFLIMNEYSKTSGAFVEKLEELGISYCYMNEFSKGNAQEFKNTVLFKALSDVINKFNSEGVFEFLDVDDLLHHLYIKAGVRCEQSQLEKEKKNFFDKYLRGGLVIKPVSVDGKLTFRIEIEKK